MLILRFFVAVSIAAGLTNLTLAAEQRVDVSQVIGKAEAAAILGEPVNDPSPRSGDGADGYYSKCNYYTVRRGKSLVIRFQLPGPNAVPPRTELDLLGAANGAMEKITGVGDAAQMLQLAGGMDENLEGVFNHCAFPRDFRCLGLCTS